MSVDAAGVLAAVIEALPNNQDGSPAVRGWSFVDPLQAKRHAQTFDADLTPAQRAKLAAVPEPAGKK